MWESQSEWDGRKSFEREREREKYQIPFHRVSSSLSLSNDFPFLFIKITVLIQPKHIFSGTDLLVTDEWIYYNGYKLLKQGEEETWLSYSNCKESIYAKRA